MHQFDSFFKLKLQKQKIGTYFIKKKKKLYKPLLSTYLQSITYKFKT